MAKKQKKPWAGICCKRCYFARTKRCRCRCEGILHGAGHYGRKTELTEYMEPEP